MSYVMDPRTFVDTAAPTPYGWVITTQSQFDLDTILAFRGQLASLSKFFESQKPTSPAAAPEEVQTEADALQPVHVRTAS
jgi:hypothetical protein